MLSSRSFLHRLSGFLTLLFLSSTDCASAADASASKENPPNETAAKLFDGSTSTKWYAPATGSAWVQFNYGISIKVVGYTLTSANDMPTRDPRDWQFQASGDGINWTTLDSRSGQSFSARYQAKSYSITNSASYPYYRLNITANSGGATAGVQLSELSFSAAVENARITFRPQNVSVPDGFFPDTGRDFGLQNGLRYGWEAGTSRSILKKKLNENEVLMCHAQLRRNSKWQISLENGMYDVSVCVGSPEDSLEYLPLFVERVAYFNGKQAGKNVFLKQTKTVSVSDGTLTLELDANRIPADWDTKGRFVAVSFVEIVKVSSIGTERNLVWSVDSSAATDRQFYGWVPDIRSTAKPTSNLLNTLWYKAPAKIWEQGMPLGNGRLGAVVYGNPVREVIQFNEDTLWNGAPGLPFANPDGKSFIDQARQLIFANRPESEIWDYIWNNIFNWGDGTYGQFMFDYLNGGELLLNFPDGPVEGYYRSLDLSDGIALTRYLRNGIEYKQEVFSSADCQNVVVRLTAASSGAISFAASTRDEYGATISTEAGNTLLVTGKAPDKKNLTSAIRYQRRMKFLPEGGTISATTSSINITNANAVTILVSIRTNFIDCETVTGDPVQRSTSDISNAQSRSYDSLRAAHVADHRRLYDRMTLNLGAATSIDSPTDERIRNFSSTNDPQMAALVFQFGRYLLMGCSRPGTQAANLQGIWNPWYAGAWGGKYTVNINIQMNYWLPEPANLSECHLPFLNLIEDVANTGQVTAQEYYGSRGWVCHHNTDVWRYNHPIDGKAGMWPMASAWFCDHIWDHYLYTQDRTFLQSMYPVMRDASLFYVDFLVEDPRSGYLVTAPSMSPENGGIHAAPTMDVQLLNSLFSRTVQAARILGVDVGLQSQFEQTRTRLPPMMIGSWGQLQEWTDGDFDNPNDHNRHVSHLYGLHPGDQITPWRTPQLFDAAKVSLIARGDDATGWSLGWKTNFWARFRDGNHAYDILKLLIRPSYDSTTNQWRSGLYPNFFDAHPPFQIDGNFGTAAGILEMLVQSQNGEIDLLPALPSSWPSGSITGMRVRGGFEIDFRWAASKPVRLTVRRKGGSVCKVRSGNVVKQFTVPSDGPLVLDGNLNQLTTGSGASASKENPPSETAPKLFDGSTSTKWFAPAVGAAWVQYNFGSGDARKVTGYLLSSANDMPQRDPKNWQFEGSNDGSTWTTLDTRTGETFNARFQTRAFTFSNTTAYQYYRLNVTANNGGSASYGVQLSEMLFTFVP